MNKTTNFQLTQWEKTDRIMMEDFNRDNAAIDAALKSNAEAVAAETAAREAADTALGDAATDVEELGFYLTVVDQGGSGGTVIDPEKPDYKTGDEFSPVWYVLAPGAAALIVIITGINTKRRHKRG